MVRRFLGRLAVGTAALLGLLSAIVIYFDDPDRQPDPLGSLPGIDIELATPTTGFLRAAKLSDLDMVIEHIDDRRIEGSLGFLATIPRTAPPTCAGEFTFSVSGDYESFVEISVTSDYWDVPRSRPPAWGAPAVATVDLCDRDDERAWPADGRLFAQFDFVAEGYMTRQVTFGRRAVDIRFTTPEQDAVPVAIQITKENTYRYLDLSAKSHTNGQKVALDPDVEEQTLTWSLQPGTGYEVVGMVEHKRTRTLAGLAPDIFFAVLGFFLGRLSVNHRSATADPAPAAATGSASPVGER